MKFYTLFTISLIFQLLLNAQDQTDYKTFRDSLNIVVCGNRDSMTLTTAIEQLTSFDTTKLRKNIYKYYSDLAICNWELARWHPKEKQNEMIEHGVHYYHQSLFHDPKNTQTLWNLMFSYFVLGDCEHTMIYLALYKENEKRKYWDKDEIKRISKFCNF
ncbi:MAG: hypothetical protein RLZZ546_161 [Bacteroidota bacterium]|jgi:hypothetical protein